MLKRLFGSAAGEGPAGKWCERGGVGVLLWKTRARDLERRRDGC